MIAFKNDRKQGYIFILTVCLTLLLFAYYLNKLFYGLHGPFYDSLSYELWGAKVIELVRQGHWYDFITYSFSNETVILPFIQLAMLSLFCDPGRAMGVLINALWLTVLAIVLFHYFNARRHLPILQALAYTLPFISASMMFQYNGGLSDFRMDLLEYLILASAYTFILCALEKNKRFYWLIAGLFLGFTCLSRTTAPAIIIPSLIPILVFSDWKSSSSTRINLFLMIIMAAAVSSWFYIAGGQFIYWYYFVWNYDTSAHLPLSESWHHAEFIARDIGIGWLIFCLFAFLINIFEGWQKNGKQIFKQTNWHPLWLGIVPCILLMIQGVGLNAFISMPAVFGILMFLLQPIRTLSVSKSIDKLSCPLLAAALIICTCNAVQGITSHKKGSPKPMISTMKCFDDITAAIISDMRIQHKKKAIFSCTYLNQINNISIMSVFVFDCGFKAHLDCVFSDQDGLKISEDGSLQSATETDWHTHLQEAATDEQKLNVYVTRISNLDYVIIPDENSAKLLDGLSYPVMNRYCSRLRKLIMAASRLQPITKVINMSSYDTVQVYRVLGKK